MRPCSTTTARPRTGSAPVPSIRVAPTRTSDSMRPLDFQARVERVAEPVTEEIDAEDGDENGQAREGREPPRGREIRAAVGEHAAPGRGGGWTPRPRKDSADSMTMTRAMSRVATTS